MAPSTVDRRQRPWRCPYDIFLCCLRCFVVVVAAAAAAAAGGGGVVVVGGVGAVAAVVVGDDPSTPLVTIRTACPRIPCHSQPSSTPWSADRRWADHTARVAPWDLCPKTHCPCMV